MIIPHFRDEYRLIYPVYKAFPFSEGWPDVTIPQKHQRWWCYPTRSFFGWPSDAWVRYNGRTTPFLSFFMAEWAGFNWVQLTVCLLVVQKWPQNTLVHHGSSGSQFPSKWCRQECRVQRGMMKEMQLDASAPWDQLLCEKWHGLLRFPPGFVEHGNNMEQR